MTSADVGVSQSRDSVWQLPQQTNQVPQHFSNDEEERYKALLGKEEENLTEEERDFMKRHQKLLRNREAAQLFRARQRQHYTELKTRCNGLEYLTASMREKISEKESENMQIRDQLAYLRQFIKEAVDYSCQFASMSSSGFSNNFVHQATAPVFTASAAVSAAAFVMQRPTTSAHAPTVPPPMANTQYSLQQPIFAPPPHPTPQYTPTNYPPSQAPQTYTATTGATGTSQIYNPQPAPTYPPQTPPSAQYPDYNSSQTQHQPLPLLQQQSYSNTSPTFGSPLLMPALNTNI
ncbi:hypothetical protein Pelo_4977 [Pelomyxa schiedti]|nr:hypothetical protein Pelo_4977 [Pelomyxa schiedti]